MTRRVVEKHCTKKFALIFGPLESSVSKRVVLANVPSLRCFGGGGASKCTLVPVFGAGEHPPKPPFWKPPSLRTPGFVRGKKKHINIDKFGGLSRRDWVGAEIQFMCFLGVHSLWGRKNTNRTSPPKFGTIPRIFCFCVFICFCFVPNFEMSWFEM